MRRSTSPARCIFDELPSSRLAELARAGARSREHDPVAASIVDRVADEVVACARATLGGSS